MPLMSYDYVGGMEQFGCEFVNLDDILPSHSPGSENSFGSSGSNDGWVSNDYINSYTVSSFGCDLGVFEKNMYEIGETPPTLMEPSRTLIDLDIPSHNNFDYSWSSEELRQNWQYQQPSTYEMFDPTNDFPLIKPSDIEAELKSTVRPFKTSLSDIQISTVQNKPLKANLSDIPISADIPIGSVIGDCRNITVETVAVMSEADTTKTSKKAERSKSKTKIANLASPGRKQVLLWQFLYHALQHPNEYGHTITWTDMSHGIFEFSSKNKDDLARAWGAVKNNKCTMTYPKLARALRKYIEGNKFLTKNKRKLQYKFTPDFLEQLRNNSGIRNLSESDKQKMYENSRKQR